MGSIASEAVTAVETLAGHGVSCALLVVSCLNPSPIADLVEALSSFRISITVEAHYIVGGLGSLVAEIIAENGLTCRLVRCGVRDVPNGITGSQDHMLRLNGLKSDQIVAIVLKVMHNELLFVE
jgi:transketolase